MEYIVKDVDMDKKSVTFEPLPGAVKFWPESVLVSEEELGIEKLVQELSESYVLSCTHNNTTTDDIEYFKEYVWVMFATIMKGSQKKDCKKCK